MKIPISRLVATFHYVVNERYSIDVTVARTKAMLALVSLTWPDLGIVVTPHFITPGRLTWQSEVFNVVCMGGSFRRDPVGDDASIILDDDEMKELVMPDEMRACAGFIPMFGRQKMERFNLAVAELFVLKANTTLLPPSGSDSGLAVSNEEEYQRLRDWLVTQGAVTPEGEWVRQLTGGSDK